MIIRIKKIDEERLEDAPFVGALVSGVSCHNTCKNCFNRGLKKSATVLVDGESLVKNVKKNKLHEGIIFGGLEWSEQIEELLEVCRLASGAGLKIMIYTGLSLTDFYSKIGEYASKKYDYRLDKETTIYIGMALLDFYIKTDLYIKYGAYDKNMKTDDYYVFGVKLASSNQGIICLKEESNDAA